MMLVRTSPAVKAIATRLKGTPNWAAAMIVGGFIEPLVKELPMEYAVEMNRLIQLQMEGSIG